MLITHDILLDALLLITHINTAKTRKLIKELISYYQSSTPSENIDILNNDKYQFEQLIISLLQEILNTKLVKDKHSKELKTLYNKISINDIFKKHPEWLSYIQDVLDSNIQFNTEMLDNVHDKISNIVIWFRCNQHLKQMYGKLSNINPKSDPSTTQELYQDILHLSSQINSTIRHSKDVNDIAVERIHLNRKEDILKAYQTFKSRNITGVIKMGLQGLNNMCGSRKGVGLGKSVLFCALTHNYKSTMLLSIARWCRDYNKFQSKDNRKPLILVITLENEGHENMMLWFKHAAKTILQDKIELEKMSDEQIIDAIYNYFYSEDIEIAILRYLPSDFGFEELVDLITSYEDEGYYIPVCIIDYLRQMRLTSADDMYSRKGGHQLIKELFNKVCNYLKSKGITLFTAHQLNRNASMIVSSGVPYPVKRFNESHMEGSTDVAREVDMIIYMNIEKNHQGIPFLTLQWGKHRYEEDTPERYKFIAYPFTEKGIIDDIDGKFGGVKDIYNYDPENPGKNKNSSKGNQNIQVEINY